MATDSGFSNQKKKGKAQFQTIHASGSDSYAKQVIPKYLTDLVIPTVTSTISTITDILGKDGQVEFWEIAFVDPHYAMKGDVFRMKATQDDLFNWEFEIVSIVDANTIRVLPISDVKPSPFDNGIIKRWVTANADAEGNPISSSSPIKFVLDGVDTEVLEDTVIPANNRPLPVKLTGFAGDITVTANQLDVSTNSTDDSMALGDFVTGDKATVDINGVSGKGELHVRDDDAVAELVTLNTVDFATETTLGLAKDELVTLNTVDFATETTLGLAKDELVTLNAVDFATSAKQDTGNTSLSNIDGKLPADLTVASNMLLVDGSGVTQPVEGIVSLEGTVDAGNSSTTPLLSGGVFTGTAFDITNMACINVNVFSDVPSATNGLAVQFSSDGVNWDHTHATTYTAASGAGFIFNAEFQFARIVYTNGASAQTAFRLQTIFKTTKVQSSLYTLSQTINANMFAELGRSVITGETTAGGGTYVNVKVNPSGALTTESTLVDVAYDAGVSDAQTQRVVVASDQSVLPMNIKSSLLNVEYDQVVLAYVGATTDLATVTAKLAGSTVATLTFTYDGSNRLVDVTRT